MPMVLVVDDEPDVRELVKVSLELDGFEVVAAPDGATGLELLKQEYPDVVVLDVMMPEMDGWDVLAAIKKMEGDLGSTPVIMLTARTSDMDRIRGGIEGAIRYLTKPFVPDVLLGEVRAAMEGDPEPVKRKAVQQQSLEHLARLERGDTSEVAPGPAAARPHLTRLERPVRHDAPSAAQPSVSVERLESLSPKQVELLAAVAGTATVTDAAEQLEVSRSNVYASLRRIARKLDIRSVEDLIKLARTGVLAAPEAQA